MVSRDKEITFLRELIKRHRVVCITGARQVGKTTLARMLSQTWPDKVHFFDAERQGTGLPSASPLAYGASLSSSSSNREIEDEDEDEKAGSVKGRA